METMYDRPRKRKSWAEFNSYVYARKIYVRSHGKITRRWKSTLSRTDVCPFMKEKICPENY